jgi:hypothetical protein
MEILLIFGTAFLVSLLFSPGTKTIPPAAMFFLGMFLSAALYLYLIGPLNFALWGTLWLPALFFIKEFQKNKNQKRNAKMKRTKAKVLKAN